MLVVVVKMIGEHRVSLVSAKDLLLSKFQYFSRAQWRA